jgi:hypothetical protein
MKIWIDTDTGTWGNAFDMVLVDIEEEDLNALAELSDVERTAYGQKHGEPVL